MTKPRKAVVSGVGVVTPLGNSVEMLWDGLVSGRSGISRITAFDPSDLTCQIAGEVKDFDAVALLGKKEARRVDRFSQFGLVAVERLASALSTLSAT